MDNVYLNSQDISPQGVFKIHTFETTSPREQYYHSSILKQLQWNYTAIG